MTMVHYQIWSQLNDTPQQSDGRLIGLLADGTLQLSGTNSSAIQIPVANSPATTVGIFKIIQNQLSGTDRAYVEALAKGGTSSQTSAHNNQDNPPRMLIGSEDGAVLLPLPPGGSFTAVLAAPIT